MCGSLGNVLEVGGFAREAHPMFGVFLIFAPPEIRRIRDVGVRGVNDRQ